MADHRDPDIRRRMDGSIDSDFYIARAKRLHALAYRESIPRWFRHLGSIRERLGLRRAAKSKRSPVERKSLTQIP
ncbi:MAG TPA: hypothetical protein VNS02_09985 [Rhizobiaceae bacterium]|nr:hypothetical protein [Rhizobiaceae bacterium]